MAQQNDCWGCTGAKVDCDVGKTEWPELVGAKVMDAKATIERENPNVVAQPIPCHRYRIQDCCCNRVWLDYAEDSGTVCEVPKVG